MRWVELGPSIFLIGKGFKVKIRIEIKSSSHSLSLFNPFYIRPCFRTSISPSLHLSISPPLHLSDPSPFHQLYLFQANSDYHPRNRRELILTCTCSYHRLPRPSPWCCHRLPPPSPQCCHRCISPASVIIRTESALQSWYKTTGLTSLSYIDWDPFLLLLFDLIELSSFCWGSSLYLITSHRRASLPPQKSKPSGFLINISY